MANFDTLQRFPNQNIALRPDECVGETWADLNGNRFKQAMYPGFSYAGALRVSNTQPTTAGSDPYSGGLSVVLYGSLPTEDAPTDISTFSELFDANWANYPMKELASTFVQNGLKPLYSYADIVNYIFDFRQGCQLTMKWYESFSTPNQDGTLPAPSGAFSTHCVAVYEDHLLGLRIKPWLGPGFGAGGYAFLPQSVFSQVFVDSSGFNPQASRWVSLVKALLPRWYLYKDIYPQLTS